MQKSIQHHLELAPHLEKRELVQQEHEQVGPDHQFRPADAAQGRARAIPARASVHLVPLVLRAEHARPILREQHPRALQRPRRPPAHFCWILLSFQQRHHIAVHDHVGVGRGVRDSGRPVVVPRRWDAPARRGRTFFPLRTTISCPSMIGVNA